MPFVPSRIEALDPSPSRPDALISEGSVTREADMQGAVVYRWSGIVPGRERAAVQLLRDGNAFSDKMVSEGRITDWAMYVSAQGGTSYFIVRGEMEQLMADAGDPEAFALRSRSELILLDYVWGYFATGESVEGMLGVFEQSLGQLD